MTTALFFACAVLFLTVGHVFKSVRWHRFICIYENVPMPSLLSALASGYLVNFFLPLHLGDVLRFVISGRKMKNGYSYALATIIVDRCLDLVCVALMFLGFAAFTASAVFWRAVRFYAIVVAALTLLFLLAYRTNQQCKKIALKLCSLFNEQIKFQLLFFLWSLITSFKDLAQKVNIRKLILDTAAMWTAYLLSYLFIAQMLLQQSASTSLPNIFYMMFRSDALFHSTFITTHSIFSLRAELLLCAVILMPLPILIGVSFLIRQRSPESGTISLLPQLEPQERIQFLNVYFEGKNRDAMQEFLTMNQDVGIVKDCSAGSDATTMLCLSSNGAIYRKYAFGGASAEKLREQVQWLHAHEDQLPLPQICLEREGDYSFCYDMLYDSSAIGFFEYIYSRPLEQSWALLQGVLDDLHSHLYSHAAEPVSQEEIERYVSEKVVKNLQNIMQNRTLSPLAAARKLEINGETYRGLPELEGLLKMQTLCRVFAQDLRSQIHGDLTVENIVCYADRDAYYLIDPNPSNPVSTPGLDYAKLLQSLHGHYELLGYSHAVSVDGDRINFFLPDSQHYQELYLRFDRWLTTHLSPAQVRSVYFHELIHWLRLITYKIRKNENNAAKYFAEFIIVMNDVYRRFEEGQR